MRADRWRKLQILRRNRKRLAYLLAAAAVVLLLLALNRGDAIPFSNWGTIPALIFLVAGIGLASFLTHRGILGGGHSLADYSASEVLRVALQQVKLLAYYLSVATVGLLVCYQGMTEDMVQAIFSTSGTSADTGASVTGGRSSNLPPLARLQPYRQVLQARMAVINAQSRTLPGDALNDYYYRTAAQQLAARLPAATTAGARREEVRAFLVGTGTTMLNPAGSGSSSGSGSGSGGTGSTPTLMGSTTAQQLFWKGALEVATGGGTGGGDTGTGGSSTGGTGTTGTTALTESELVAQQAGELFSTLLLALDDELEAMLAQIASSGKCIDWVTILGTLPTGIDPQTMVQQYGSLPSEIVAQIVAELLRGGTAGGGTTGGGTTGGGTGTDTGGGTTGGGTGTDTTSWPSIESEVLRIYQANYSEATHRRELMDSYRRADGHDTAWLAQRISSMTPAERAAYERAVEIVAHDGGATLNERYQSYSGWDTAALRELYRRYRAAQQ